MISYKDLIKNFNKADYESGIVNLHVHSSFSDGHAEFSEIIKCACQKNMKAISITDHNTVNGYISNPEPVLSATVNGLNIIPAVEFDVWYKYIFLHLLAYGIDINNPCMSKFYAKDKKETEKDLVRFFSKRNIKDLMSSIHMAGGIAVLAHPACCWALSMDKFVSDLVKLGLDGIEVYYPYPRWRKFIKFAPVEEIDKIADKYNLIKTGGTDFHGKVL